MHEMLMTDALGPFCAFGDQFEHPQIIEHLVRIGRMRALAEHHDVFGMDIQRDIGEDRIVIIVGELIIVEF